MSIRKITNHPSIIFIWISSIVFSIITLAILTLMYTFFPETRSILYISGSIILFAIFIFNFQLQIFNFENSGEVVIISNYNFLHFLFNPYFMEKMELPLDKIISSEIKKIVLLRYLIVKIRRHNNQVITLYFSLPYLSDKNIQSIQMSLNKNLNDIVS